jgi:release factor glutamine methyltransferase
LVTTGASAIAAAVIALRQAGCVFAEDEAAVLAGAAADDATLATLVGRRALGEPLEQVVGYADFCGIRVRLRPGVFVPRVRSELLVRLAAAAVRSTEWTNHKTQGIVVVDLCCGSGALGLAVEQRIPSIELHAADLDPVAVACARDNLSANVHHLSANVHQGDLFDALPRHLAGRIAVLLANVPYVATRHIPLLPAEAKDHEPHTALDGGDDGLDVFRAVVKGAPAWLAPGGVLLSEITEAQATAATDTIRAAGLDADVVYDDDLEARVVRGVKRGGRRGEPGR